MVFDKGLQEREGCFLGNCIEGDTSFVVAESLLMLLPALMGQVGITVDELRCLAKEISKQSVGGAACFLFDPCGKMQEDIDKLN